MPVTIEPVGDNEFQLQKNVIEDEGLRRSDRNRRPPVAYGFDEYADSANCDTTPAVAYTACLIQSFKEAIQSDQSQCWKQAAEIEYAAIAALQENKTWNLVELPLERKPIGCRWIFKVKYDRFGAVERYKGRLVVKGYSQRYGIDYD